MSAVASLRNMINLVFPNAAFLIMVSILLTCAGTAKSSNDKKPKSQEPVNLAVASNFAATAKELASQFESQTGFNVRISFGSSGKLYAQIVNGAPFDVFLSADTQKPDALEQEGIAAQRRTYAIGKLALWVPNAASQPKQWSDFVTALEASSTVNKNSKIALANPRLAPYGAAAVETLKALNLEQKTQDQWVVGENIAQAFQFVSTGNAAFGFVAASQLPHIPTHPVSGEQHFILVPTYLYGAIKQDVVLLNRGTKNAAARAFYDYLGSPEAIRIIRSFGYEIDGLTIDETVASSAAN